MRTGENIYKRKDGRWEARYHKGRQENGKIIYGFCYGRTYSETKAKLEQAKRSSKDVSEVHAVHIDRKIQFEQICKDWLHSNCLRLKPSSFAKYQTMIEKHIIPALGNVFLSQISTGVISEFGLHLRADCGLAPKTVHDILVLLHGILEYGAKHFPGTLAAVDVIYPSRVPLEMRVLSRNEQSILTAYLLENLCPCKLGILLALWTGMRIGEICALRWNQIDLQEGIIKIDATMQRIRNNDPSHSGRTVIQIGSPKTPSSIREIPICSHVVELCKSMQPENTDAYVLTGSQKYVEPRLLQYHFQRYVQACNLEGVTFHTLRHTFATRCVEVDFEIKSLSEILGHTNTAITMNRYVHCSLELKRANMKKLDSINMQSSSK